ncbi:cysteinyl leukotriene receptor 1-like [Cynoglossus semilaevis]|uniref:cysteinyl leukotriene receptor 1-like n=1 Tax=Cynoglossus semilaevis TaxID=244447 RepID=UPI0004981488|nr:cysteinyl leukotriene receptor 1-like [Cynoglossus semilaevis]
MSSENCLHIDEEFRQQAYKSFYLLLCPLAFLCNAVVLVVFYKQSCNRKIPRSAFCVVIMNLALSDFSFSLTLPLRLSYYFNNSEWKHSDWLCRLCQFVFYVNLYTSIFFLTLVCVLRWLAITKPHRHRTMATPTRTLYICLGIWLFVGVSTTPFLCKGVTLREEKPRCFEPPLGNSATHILIINYLALVLGFLLPFLTLISCYSSIIRHLRNPSVPSGTVGIQRPNRRRSIHLITMVTVTFLVCFLPYHVFRTLHIHAAYGQWDCRIMVPLHRGVIVTLCFAAMNSVINPLLYYYFTKMFRDTVKDIQLSMKSTMEVELCLTEQVQEPQGRL